MRRKCMAAVLTVLTLLCIAFPAAALTIKLDRKSTNLGLVAGVNDTGELNVSVKPASKAFDVVWRSLNEDVVTVTQDGQLQAVSYGKTKVVASLETKKAVCLVTVSKKPITSITLSKKSATLYLGRSSLYLKHTLSPQYPDNPTVLWYSTKPSVASVTQEGVVTPLSKGTATIVCEAVDGSNKRAKCTVTVKAVAPTKVTLSATKLNMMEWDTAHLSYTMTPQDVTDGNVYWSSTNPKVVSVDSEGNLFALKQGKATIVCKAVCNGKIAKCAVTVKTIAPTKLVLTDTQLKMVTDTYQLQWEVRPTNAINKTVKWTSSNTKVVTVDENGLLTARGNGKAIITGKTVVGGKTAKCFVTVSATVPLKLTLSAKEVKVTLGGTKQLSYAIEPEDAPNKKVKWSSSDASVISVDADGVLTAHKVGTVTITCKTEAGGLTASCVASAGYYDSTFRAMIIGQEKYKNPSVKELPSSPYDAQIMQMLLKNSTVTGQKFEIVDKRNDLALTGISKAILLMQNWNTKDSDVSVLYYSGHGAVYNGESCILGTDYSSKTGNRILVSAIKKRLDSLKGTVIIIFDCCYSGGMADIMSKGASEALSPADAERFNSGIVSAFAQPLTAKGGGSTPTYYVLTACTIEEESYTDNGEYELGSFFTQFLGQGAGYTTSNGLLDKMVADTNKDGMCSIQELYVYTKPRVQQKLSSYNVPYTQTVTVYPAGCAFPLLGRN